MAKLKGRVRWLKANEGGGDRTLLGAKANCRGSMEKLGADIAGTDDAIALYIKLNPRALYNVNGYRPGHIGGLVWLAPMPPGRTLDSFAENSEYEIGWPSADVETEPGPALKDIVLRTYGARADELWKRLRGSMTGGKPFRVDQGDYAPLGDALTDFYRSLP